MNDLLAILLVVLGFLALLVVCSLVCAGAMFMRMCGGDYASCERIYRTWCEERDRATDEQIRAGFKKAHSLGWLPERFL